MVDDNAVEYERVDAPPPVLAGEEVPAEPGDGVVAPGSLQARVQAARSRALQTSTKDLEIPGYDGTLWGTFRAIDDFKERARVEKRWQRVRDEADRALNVAAELLRVACVDLFVPTDSFVPGVEKPGDRESLNMPFGVELAEWLGVLPPGGKGFVTDHEAMFPMGTDPATRQPYGIFPSTVALTTVAGDLHRFSSHASEQADEEAQGE